MNEIMTDMVKVETEVARKELDAARRGGEPGGGRRPRVQPRSEGPISSLLSYVHTYGHHMTSSASSLAPSAAGHQPFPFLAISVSRFGTRRHRIVAAAGSSSGRHTFASARFSLSRSLALGCHLLERGHNLRLRRAPILAEQTLLAPAPDDLVVFRHRHRDGVGVDAVRHNLRVRVHGQDGRLGSVELLPAPVSVLRRSRGGVEGQGDGSWRERDGREYVIARTHVRT